MDVVRRTLAGTATVKFMVLAAGSTFITLSLRPAFLPLVFLLAILVNYSQANARRHEFAKRSLLLLTTLGVATLAAFLGLTWTALSTQALLSSGILFVVSLAFCSAALAPILIYARTRTYVGSRSALDGLLLFPTLWATTWSLFVHISPFGRIGTWSPMAGIEAYSWITPIFGQVGIDYITALWAVVIAEFTGEWIMGPKAEHDRELLDRAVPNVDLLTPTNNLPADNSDTRRRPALYLLGLLVLGIVPSYYAPILPPPTHSENTTELTLSCVHPYIKNPSARPSLDDYLAETRTQASRAKVVLWPEGAVHFHTDKERTDAFDKVSVIANRQKAWIGVSYEQDFSDSRETVRGQRVRGHNGLVIFGPDVQPVTYIKRRLVPLVESFSLESPMDHPPRYPIHLHMPNNHPNSEKENWPRTIPIMSAICLDVSAPLATSVPVNQTDLARPALILAPARTWHPEVGKAMFQHASMRAIEQGASILWCDGGEGGVSGVGGLAAQGLGLVGGIGQVGTGGSWLQTIGIPFPYDTKNFPPTWYTRWGDLSVIFLAWAILGVGPMGPAVLSAGRLINLVIRRLMHTRNEHPPQRNENTPLLIDSA